MVPSLLRKESSKPWSTNGSSVYQSLKTLIIWPFSVKNLRAGTISGGHTWHWMVFGLMMFITTRSLRNRNVIQKRFRVISNIIDSRKHGSLGIGLKALRSLKSSCFCHLSTRNVPQWFKKPINYIWFLIKSLFSCLLIDHNCPIHELFKELFLQVSRCCSGPIFP